MIPSCMVGNRGIISCSFFKVLDKVIILVEMYAYSKVDVLVCRLDRFSDESEWIISIVHCWYPVTKYGLNYFICEEIVISSFGHT